MSGGVDSSLVAALLLEGGHHVTGVTLDLLPVGTNSGGAVTDARRVCDELGIEHVTLSAHELFESTVIQPFAEGYARGETPNPCIICNETIKFGYLLEWAVKQGFDKLATGHYARIVEFAHPISGEVSLALARARDRNKDQTYFLYRIPEAHLSHIMFPLGNFTKDEVRAKARMFNISVAEKPESQDICFTAECGRIGVISRYCPHSLDAGVVYDTDRQSLGTHKGLAHYTIGQRKGLGIGGQGEPLFVVSVDAQDNALIVGSKDDLAVRQVTAIQALAGQGWDSQVQAMIRYNMEPVSVEVSYRDGTITAHFTEPLYGVAPGQSLVCYRTVGDFDIVVGGGIIECAS